MTTRARTFSCARIVIAGLVLLALSAVTASRAQAAPLAVATSAAAATAAGREEEEADDSPRASYAHFLQLSRRGQWAEAARFVEVPRGQEKRASELAERLYVVLSRRLGVEPTDLSPLSEGRRDDGLSPQLEDIGKLGNAGEPKIPVRLVRRDAKDGDDARWIFSAQTMARVDAWYDGLGDTWIRRRLPPWLFVEVAFGFLVYQLVSLPVLALFSFAVGMFLSRVLGRVIAAVVRKEPWRSYVVELSKPLGLCVALVLAHVFLSRLGFYLTAFAVLERLRDAVLVIACSWAVLRMATVFAENLREQETVRKRVSRRTLVDLAERSGRFAVVVVAILVTLQQLGVGVTNLIAGLGIGGVALALAAQKTVENLFGSVSILGDQPFRVGELIRVDGIEGTVETIGLRSTRLRTADRTLIVIPNGKLADMRIEAFGGRDRFRVQLRVELDAEGDPTQVESALAAIRKRIDADDLVRKEDVLVRASGLSAGTIELEIGCYASVVTIPEFSDVRQALLLDCLRLFRERSLKLVKPAR